MATRDTIVIGASAGGVLGDEKGGIGEPVIRDSDPVATWRHDAKGTAP